MILKTDMTANPVDGSWITIGSFDGVHLGHQSLIKKLVATARENKAKAVVVTFWPHPSAYFAKAQTPRALNTAEERRELLLDLKVDEVVTLPFDRSIAEMTANEFLEFLKKEHGMKGLIIGPNTTIGKGRGGTPETLQQITAGLGVSLKVAEAVALPGEMVSSSAIRKLLQENRISQANQMLGRPYRLSGRVVHGEHRGSGLGVPTANLQIPVERLIPANGVYVTRAVLEGKAYASVTNIGVRPTFENPLPSPRIEPHILDMKDQIYDRILALEFMEYLRPEIKFNDPSELVAQIQKDISATREFFQVR